MSVRVTAKGASRMVVNPANGQRQEMVLVTFTEYSKRNGGNASLSNSSNALDKVLGIETGLQQFRTHSQLLTPEAAAQLQIDQEIGGLYINRTLSSFPAMVQQGDVRPRLVDNKPTFFQTSLDETPKKDVDERLDNNVLATMKPEFFLEAQLGATVVDVLGENGENRGDVRAYVAQQKSAVAAGGGSQTLESATATTEEKSHGKTAGAKASA